MERLNVCLCESETEEEQIKRIEEVLEDFKGKKGSLIQALHMVQGIYGYLPVNIQQLISERMEIPMSEVSGVISFYSFFSTKPKGKYTINVCLGTACYVRGGKKIVDKLMEILKIGIGETTSDGLFSLEVMRCIGACGLAPAISINDKVYKQVNPDKLGAILSHYRQEGYDAD